MNKLNITKNQHYVSQGVLKHFSDEKNKIFELFIEKELISKKCIDNTMSQKFVYEHPRIKTNTVENIFAKFESKAFPLIDGLIYEIENNYENKQSIIGLMQTIKSIIPYVLLFYFRSGALLKEYSMDAEEPKNTKVERMLLNIMDVNYIRGLKDTICNYYKCGIIVDEKERFLLSDQYVSTVALMYKNRFSNASNRQIGMKETMILIPLTSKFYIVFYNGRIPSCIGENVFSVLNDDSVNEINNVIFQNSYVKCVGKSESELERVKSVPIESYSPIKCIMKYSDGSIQDRIIKREVFLYDEDKDMNAHSYEYMSTYIKDIKDKLGRNDVCVCGSGIKYKKCCMKRYETVARILRETQNPRMQNYTIPGVRVTEDSILEYQGPQEKMTNRHDKGVIEKIFEMTESDTQNP